MPRRRVRRFRAWSKRRQRYEEVVVPVRDQRVLSPERQARLDRLFRWLDDRDRIRRVEPKA